MFSRDSNDATWYWLGYAADFTGQPAGPYLPDQPLADSTLSFDDARHVLELLPVIPSDPRTPLPGIAVGTDGEVYVAGADDCGRTEIVVQLCDQSRRQLVCDPFTFAGPRGMALDRRGLLYVADSRACRVTVVDTESGSVIAILGHPDMQEPVDVAVHPAGWVFVADDKSGSIFVFSAAFSFLQKFTPRNGEHLPVTPRPIAIMIEPDGSISVADASHPRLLHFTPGGEALADLPAPVSPGLSDSTVRPRAIAGVCNDPRPSRETAVILADYHRALRLRALSLAASYETHGQIITRALDSGIPGTQWHRIELHAVIPKETSVTIETATSDELVLFDPATALWSAPVDTDGAPIPFDGTSQSLADPSDNQLIQAPPGRYLWLRITLTSDGSATPSMQGLRVLYPRFSYLELLPRVYRQDPEADRFLQHYLALFEFVLTGVEDRYEEFSRLLNPAAASMEVINWLACLVDLTFDPSWPLEKRRELIGSANELYRLRGTKAGLARYLEIYTGIRPEIQELFLERPTAPSYLGQRGAILGCGWQLSSPVTNVSPDQTLFQSYAHRFRVILYDLDPCTRETLAAVVDRIVAVNRPAHTAYTIVWITPDVRLGIQSQVGIDFVLGGRETPTLELADDENDSAGRVLGQDAVLGSRRHGYVTPLGVQI